MESNFLLFSSLSGLLLGLFLGSSPCLAAPDRGIVVVLVGVEARH